MHSFLRAALAGCGAGLMLELSLLVWDYDRLAADPAVSFEWGCAVSAAFYGCQFVVGAGLTRLFARRMRMDSWLPTMVTLGFCIAATDYVHTFEIFRRAIAAAPYLFLTMPVVVNAALALTLSRMFQSSARPVRRAY